MEEKRKFVIKIKKLHFSTKARVQMIETNNHFQQGNSLSYEWLPEQKTLRVWNSFGSIEFLNISKEELQDQLFLRHIQISPNFVFNPFILSLKIKMTSVLMEQIQVYDDEKLKEAKPKVGSELNRPSILTSFASIKSEKEARIICKRQGMSLLSFKKEKPREKAKITCAVPHFTQYRFESDKETQSSDSEVERRLMFRAKTTLGPKEGIRNIEIVSEDHESSDEDGNERIMRRRIAKSQRAPSTMIEEEKRDEPPVGVFRLKAINLGRGAVSEIKSTSFPLGQMEEEDSASRKNAKMHEEISAESFEDQGIDLDDVKSREMEFLCVCQELEKKNKPRCYSRFSPNPNDLKEKKDSFDQRLKKLERLLNNPSIVEFDERGDALHYFRHNEFGVGWNPNNELLVPMRYEFMNLIGPIKRTGVPGESMKSSPTIQKTRSFQRIESGEDKILKEIFKICRHSIFESNKLKLQQTLKMMSDSVKRITAEFFEGKTTPNLEEPSRKDTQFLFCDIIDLFLVLVNYKLNEKAENFQKWHGYSKALMKKKLFSEWLEQFLFRHNRKESIGLFGTKISSLDDTDCQLNECLKSLPIFAEEAQLSQKEMMSEEEEPLPKSQSSSSLILEFSRRLWSTNRNHHIDAVISSFLEDFKEESKNAETLVIDRNSFI